MNLKELAKEYKEQENGGTALPFYVEVQERVIIGIMHKDYSICLPGGETKIQYGHPFFEDFFDSKKEINEELKKSIENLRGTKTKEMSEIERQKKMVKKHHVGYCWIAIQPFLTLKAANQFIEDEAHNHGKMRTYIKPFETRNYEMRDIMKELKLY